MIGKFRSVRGRRDEGASAVEFALLLPVLLVLVTFGIMAFGLILFAQQSVQHTRRAKLFGRLQSMKLRTVQPLTPSSQIAPASIRRRDPSVSTSTGTGRAWRSSRPHLLSSG